MSIYRETRKIGSKLKKSQIIVAPSVQPVQPPGATPNRHIFTKQLEVVSFPIWRTTLDQYAHGVM